jgi:hypothetical protein
MGLFASFKKLFTRGRSGGNQATVGGSTSVPRTETRIGGTRTISGPSGPPVPRSTTHPHGHRGLALGDVRQPDLSRAREAAERGQDLFLASDEVHGFVHEQEPLFVRSTNVAMAQYFKADEKLMIEYLNGSAYLYSDVSERMALDFAQSPSKGDWVWSHLRVRGSRTEHRVPYERVR